MENWCEYVLVGTEYYSVLSISPVYVFRTHRYHRSFSPLLHVKIRILGSRDRLGPILRNNNVNLVKQRVFDSLLLLRILRTDRDSPPTPYSYLKGPESGCLAVLVGGLVSCSPLYNNRISSYFNPPQLGRPYYAVIGQVISRLFFVVGLVPLPNNLIPGLGSLGRSLQMSVMLTSLTATLRP